MAQNWFCQVLGQELGPMTSHQLLEMAKNHNLLPTDLVRRKNSRWVKAKTVKGLFEPGSSLHEKPHASSEPPESPSDTDLEETQFLGDTINLEDSPSGLVRGLNPGAMLGNYVILQKLGEGGMGLVLKAQHRRMDRTVALKVMHSEATGSPAAVKRFQLEVKAAARLVHQNIVTAYDADEAHGAHFLVMEYVDGSDLAEIIKRNGPLPIRDAVTCVLQAARGLAYAHSEGVVHRDIKPGNLLIDKRGTVKILDMGLARIEETANAVKEATSGDSLTEAGQVLGTLDYMSPEQAEDARNVDQRGDIYSLGCTFHRLLTGQAPYHGETVVNKIMAHRNHPIPVIADHRKGVPAELESVFRRMVAKRPDDRYPSMNDVVTDLEMFLSSGKVRGETTRLAAVAFAAAAKGKSTKAAAPLADEGPIYLADDEDSGSFNMAAQAIDPRTLKYFCSVMGEQIGPLTYDQLVVMAKKNQLTGGDTVRREGEDRWFQANEIEGVF